MHGSEGYERKEGKRPLVTTRLICEEEPDFEMKQRHKVHYCVLGSAGLG